MKMTVRACVFAAVLILLGTSSMFAQNNVWFVGAPGGVNDPYAVNGAADYNLAMNREGNKELGAPVTICSGTGASGATTTNGAGSSTTTFNVGDVFVIEYKQGGAGAGSPDPILVTTGALGAANLQITQGAAGTGVLATATAAMVTPGTVAGVAPTSPLALVTITVTQAPIGGGAANQSGENCITVQGLRFDLGTTGATFATGAYSVPATGVTAGSVIYAVITQPSVNGGAVAGTVGGQAAPTLSLAAGNTGPLAALGSAAITAAFPAVASNAVGTAFSTLGATGLIGVANPTGFTTGGFSVTPAASKTGLGASTPFATVGSPSPAFGTISVQENVITSTVTVAAPVLPAGALAVNLPLQDGGALIRGFVASGPDATTWLNASGATTGTSITITVNKLPTGATVVFPATVTTASAGAGTWIMTGGGTISTSGGTVVYTTTTNEGPAVSLSTTTAGVGANIDIPFTVTPGTGSGTAQVILAVTPATGASATPTYSPINAVTVQPSQAVGATQQSLFTIASNQTTRTYPYVSFTGGTTPTDYNTGIVISNTGRGVSTVSGASCNTVAIGETIPTGCGGTSGGTTATAFSFGSINGGQDGAFTVFFMTPSTTTAGAIASIRSTASNFPSSATGCPLVSGALPQGATCAVLLSQLLTSAGVTGAFQGEVRIVTDFPNSDGFAFVSQFTNPSGGATMGYKVTQNDPVN